MTTTEPASTTRGEVASTTETASDNYVPPNQEDLLEAPAVDYEAEVLRLADYLATEFPEQMNRTNVQFQDSPVSTAIRLLGGLHAALPPSAESHCSEQYCNKPAGHQSAHGWVHRT